MAKLRRLADKVSIMTPEQIRAVAHSTRDVLAEAGFVDKKLNILKVIEQLSNKQIIYMKIVEDSDLPNEEAVTVFKGDKTILLVRQSVYDDAVDDKPRARYTMAHELGHFILHKNTERYFAFSNMSSFHHHTEDCEWQANQFASELLADSRLINYDDNPRIIADTFGVSMQVAGYVHERCYSDGVFTKKENVMSSF